MNTECLLTGPFARKVVATCLCVLATAGLACDDPVAEKPVTPPVDRLGALTRPAEAGPYTWHDYYRECLEFNRATLGDAYRTAGARGPWDADAERFFERLALHLSAGAVGPAYQPAAVPPRKELIAEAKAILDLRCGDALIAYFHAGLMHDEGDREAAAPLLRQAALDMLETGYPPYRKFIAAMRADLLKITLDNSNQAARSAAYHQQRLMVRGLRTNIERRRVLAVLADRLDGGSGAGYQSAAETLEKDPEADAWVVDTLMGKAHIKLAWESRGSGWANTVTEEGWKGFYHHLGLARERLTRAWKLRPELPEAPTTMITVAMGAGHELDEQPMTWFERAETAQLDFKKAYDVMLGGPLLPRWGGSHREMYELGLRAAGSQRYDTIVPYELLDAVRAIVADDSGSWEVLSWPGVYEELGKMFDGYERQPARPQFGPPWHRSLRAAVAWRAGRHDEARRLLDQLGEDVLPNAFITCKAKSPEAAIGQVYAMTGKEAQRVKQAEAALTAGDPAEALETFRAAAKAVAAAEPRARPYFDARIEMLEKRARLANNEWVALRASPGLPGWQPLAGRWELVEEDGSIRGTHEGHRTSAILMCTEDLGARYEFAGRIHREGDAAAALVLESPGREFVFLSFGPREAVVHFTGGTVPLMAELPDGELDVGCVFEHGRLTLRVNGKVVAQKFGLAPSFAAGSRVGLSVPGEGSARFAILRVRRLPPDAPAEGTEPHESDGS